PRADVRVRLSAPRNDLSRSRRRRYRLAKDARRAGDTEAHVGERRALLPADVDPMGLSGDGGSRGGEIVREILVGSDAAARQAQPERLAGEHLELSAIALETVGMEVVAHHGGRRLQLRVEPRRGVRESLLRRGEAVV